MSPVRLVVALVFVGLACWLIWPTDPQTSAQHGDSTQEPIASRQGGNFHGTTPLPTLSTDEDGHVSIAEDVNAERVRIEGIVIDEQKAPIGGATVRFGTRETTAEADGTFELEDVPAGNIILRAERGEWYGEEDTIVSADGDPIEITVRRGSTMVLHVVKRDGGAPIVNAKVEIARRELYTNAQGVIRARGLDPTGERFTVSADGFGTWRGDADFDTEHPTAEKEMTVKLASGAAVSGIVIDEKGARVPEAHVYISAVDNTWSDSVEANDKGEFTIPAIAPGKHTMNASSKIHLSTPDQLVTHDGVHPLTNVVIKVTIGAELVGRVVDANGKPVAGATIRGAPGPDTDEDGRFRSTGIEAGELTLSAYAGTLSSEEKKVTVAIGKTTEVQFVIRDSSLAGRVVDTKGTSIADAQLWAKATDDSNTYFATSDEYGKFDFGGMPPGDYILITQHEEEANRRVPDEKKLVVHTGRRDLTIVMPGLATITARVVLDGTPVPYYGVMVTKTPDKLYSERVTTVQNETGTFAQKDIAQGTWSVVILGPNFATKTIDNVVATEGRTTDLGTITVERGRIVRGRVTDTSGRPVANALVVIGESLFSLASNRVDQRTQGDATARTDGDGRYEIAGLSNEELKIVARGANDSTSLERVLAPKETVVDLVVQEVGTVVGHIANMQKEQTGILLTLPDAESVLSGQRFYGDVDRAGDFRVTKVPPGHYQIRVMGDNTLPERELDVVANRETRIDFEMPAIQIKITVHTPKCSLVYLNGPDLHALSVCSDGTATWDAVGPGDYTVCESYRDDTCQSIHVIASPSEQRFDITFPEEKPEPEPEPTPEPEPAEHALESD